MSDTFKCHPRMDIVPGDRDAKVGQTFMRRVQARFFLRFHKVFINGSSYVTRW